MNRDSWWIEYLEDEMDPSLQADLETLLARSESDRISLESLSSIRTWIKESDPMEDLWRPEFEAESLKKTLKAVETAMKPSEKKSRARANSQNREDLFLAELIFEGSGGI